MAKTRPSELTDSELDRLLANAAASGPEPSEALLARVMADADAVLAERGAGAGLAPVGAVPRGWLRSFADAIGGWPAIAGLATATVAGIWIGYAQPGSVSGIADGFLATGASYDLGDFMPEYDTLLVEG